MTRPRRHREQTDAEKAAEVARVREMLDDDEHRQPFGTVTEDSDLSDEADQPAVRPDPR